MASFEALGTLAWIWVHLKRWQLTSTIFWTLWLPPDRANLTPINDPPENLAARQVQLCEFEGHKSYLYSPPIDSARLVIVHQGHSDSLGAEGLRELAARLLDEGHAVLLAGMPGRAGNRGSPDHGTYESLRPFVAHVNAALNALPQFQHVTLVGLSGGGWTTTVYAALDERIDLSIEVAGSLPMFLRAPTAPIDWEQIELAGLASYPELYLMGTTAGRKRIQILNRYDSCCFAHSGPAGAYGDLYEVLVVWPISFVAELFDGTFEWYEDTSHRSHKISSWAREQVIVPALALPERMSP